MYVSFRRLDEWIEQQRVSLVEDRLTMADGANFRLLPAVLFVTVVGGDADPNGLLGKVKTATQLSHMKAEHYKDSVLLGDVGYQVLEGFVGEPA
jgi:hypothetical protein